MTEVTGPAAVVKAIIAAREDDDLETSLRFIAPDSLDQGRPVTRADWRRKWEHMRADCPDLKVVAEHSVENGEWVANRYTISGTQAPTGERFEIRGMDMVRVRDGRLVEHWVFADPLPQ